MIKILNPKLLLVVLLIAVGYFAWTQPQSIPHQQAREMVLGIKSSQTDGDISTVELNTPYIVDQAQKVLASFAQNTSLPSEITGLPEEIVVEDVVTNLSGEIKKLPAKEAKKIKTEFCMDVINEYTATVAGTTNHGQE